MFKNRSYLRGSLSLLLLSCLGGASVGCSDEAGSGAGVTCGEGTSEEDGSCVAASKGAGSCGDGTSLVDGECVADTLLTSIEKACGEGTSFDSDSESCVSDTGGVSCGAGTMESDGKCAVDPESACSEGTSWDGETNSCSADVSCGTGTVAHEGECLTPNLVDWLSADAQKEPAGDWVSTYSPSHALELAAAGQATLFQGTIEPPREQPHFVDRDRWSFEAKRGDVVRVSVSPVSEGIVGFRVIDQGGQFVRVGPTGAAGMVREVLIPADGTYFIEVAPQDALLQDSDEVGGGGFDYLGSIEWRPALEAGAPVAVDEEMLGDFEQGPGYFPLSVAANSLTAIQPFVGPDSTEAVAMIRQGSGDWITTGTGFSLIYSKTSSEIMVRGDYQKRRGGESAYQVFSSNIEFIDEGSLSLGVDKVIHDDLGEWTAYVVGVSAGQRVFVRSSRDDVQAELYLGNGRPVSNAPEVLDSDGFRFNVEGTTQLILYVRSASGEEFDLTLSASAFTDLGDLEEVGDELTYSWGPLANAEAVYYRFDASPGLDIWAEVEAPAGQEMNVWLSDRTRDFDSSLRRTVSDLAPAWDGGELFELYVQSYGATDGHDVRVRVLGAPVLSTASATREAAAASGQELSLQHRTVGFAKDDGSMPDVHKITVTEAANYRFAADSTEFLFDSTLSLMAEDGSVIEQTGYQLEAEMLLDPGTYYVELSGDSEEANKSEWYEYALHTTSTPVESSFLLDQGANDSADEAQALAGNNWTVAGAVHQDSDEDWYSFTASSSGAFEIQLAPLFDGSMSDDSVAVFQAGGSSKLTPNSPGSYSLVGGTSYLIQVSGNSGLGAYRLSLDAAPILGSSSPNLAFDETTTVEDKISVSAPGCVVGKIVVEIDISHTFRGDIELDLKAPGGQSLRFFEDQGAGADHLLGLIPGTFEPTASLDFFDGLSADGEWTLAVGDDAVGDDGVLNAWGLKVYCQ